VETLEAAGVSHCWGVPGDALNYFTDAIRRSKIEWVHVRHAEVGGSPPAPRHCRTSRAVHRTVRWAL
jgi:glyoxylate carboligase